MKRLISVLLFLKIFLYPITVLYNLITKLRNFAFDFGLLKSYQSKKIFTISIGNLTVGGTGKTPHTEFFVRELLDFQPVVLSRGYGRKTKGYQLACLGDLPSKIGDEPLQIYEKFSGKVPVVVCEKRVEGVKRIEKEYPNCKLIILDDAFQHRAIKPHFQILLNDFNRPFYKDFLMPSGRLRESRDGAKRADALIVSKSPSAINNSLKKQIKDSLKIYINKDTIYFSSNQYDKIVAYQLKGSLEKNLEIIAVSAIAQPQHFENQLSKDFIVKKHFIFSDHHSFTERDVEEILNLEGNYPIVSTEKDYIKLKYLLDSSNISRFYFLPLCVEIENSESLLSDLKNLIYKFYE